MAAFFFRLNTGETDCSSDSQASLGLESDVWVCFGLGQRVGGNSCADGLGDCNEELKPEFLANGVA